MVIALTIIIIIIIINRAASLFRYRAAFKILHIFAIDNWDRVVWFQSHLKLLIMLISIDENRKAINNREPLLNILMFFFHALYKVIQQSFVDLRRVLLFKKITVPRRTLQRVGTELKAGCQELIRVL